MGARTTSTTKVAAGVVERADAWSGRGLHARLNLRGSALGCEPWPVRRTPRWRNTANDPLDDRSLEPLRTSVNRGRPYGAPTWVERRRDRGSGSRCADRDAPRKATTLRSVRPPCSLPAEEPVMSRMA